ncbi:MAG: glutamate synthase subunit alpha, partial [Bacteroidota bacterium]
MESEQRYPQSSKPQSSLYTPQLEHDSCGIGCIAHLKGEASHQIITDALGMLCNMEHRGARGCDPQTGDGAGILIQLPDAFLRQMALKVGITLPAKGSYGAGNVFFPQDAALRLECKAIIAEQCEKLNFNVLGYRPLDTYAQAAQIGTEALETEPVWEQLFVVSNHNLSGIDLERRLYLLRRSTAHKVREHIVEAGDDFYFTSLSHRTMVYKGQLRTDQVGPYFGDLHDERVVSALALVHSRFSTNTFPKWRLAQPFRYIAHNGEINTIAGNVNWMRAKESIMRSAHFSDEELQMLMPICDEAFSDSGNLDAVVELLVMSGRSLPHVMMMLIPEAWQEHTLMDPDRKAFYDFHATLMEPWD